MLRREVNTILSSSSNLHIVIIGLVKGPALKDETKEKSVRNGELTLHPISTPLLIHLNLEHPG